MHVRFSTYAYVRTRFEVTERKLDNDLQRKHVFHGGINVLSKYIAWESTLKITQTHKLTSNKKLTGKDKRKNYLLYF